MQIHSYITYTYVHTYVTGFEKSQFPHTITLFRNTDFYCLKCCISERKTDACMQFMMICYLMCTATVSCDGENCVLLFCAWKMVFVKSSHIPIL